MNSTEELRYGPRMFRRAKWQLGFVFLGAGKWDFIGKWDCKLKAGKMEFDLGFG